LFLPPNKIKHRQLQKRSKENIEMRRILVDGHYGWTMKRKIIDISVLLH